MFDFEMREKNRNVKKKKTKLTEGQGFSPSHKLVKYFIITSPSP